MKKPKAKRTAAQAAATKKFAAAGRAAQKRTRAYNLAHHLPTRTKAQKQASLRWAAAGRESQRRKRQHLKPLPKHKRAMPYEVGGDGVGGGIGIGEGAGGYAGAWPVLYQPGAACAATAVANHLFLFTGVAASQEQIMELHHAAGGDGAQGVVIADMLDVLAVRGLAGIQVERFWPVAGWDDLPGFVAGLRLPQGAHTVLTLGGSVCASWGSTRILPGYAEEAWWIEWARSFTG